MARVIECARTVPGVDRLVLATDSQRIADAVSEWQVETVMTLSTHESGTDRVAEVSRMPEYAGYDVVVNLQGDEPFMPPKNLLSNRISL